MINKSVLGTVFWVLFFGLMIVWWRYIIQLQSTVETMNNQVEQVSNNFQVLLWRFESTENAHGAAEIEIEDLNTRILMLEDLVNEQDRILQDIALQVSF